MLPLQFFGENLHFAINLLAALVFFAVSWLYIDAWLGRREAKELWKWVGYLLLSAGFIANATIIEGALGTSVFGNQTWGLALALRLAGYLMVAFGVLLEPMQAVPKNPGLELGEKGPSSGAVAGMGGLGTAGLVWAVPAACLVLAGLYLRRATRGLERHLMPLAVALGMMGLSEFVGVARLWRGTDDPMVFSLVAPFGPLWWAQLTLLALGGFLTGRWVWRYLIKRLQSQLFMILTSMVLGIYLLTTMSFTFLLLQGVQNESLSTLETASKVLGYALDSKKTETMANAEVIAQNAEVVAAVQARDHAKLDTLTAANLEAKKMSDLTITNDSGLVLVRASDPDRWGDSLSGDGLVKRALIGSEASSVVSRAGVLAPEIVIESATPIRSGGQVIGTVTVGIVADTAFVDGIKAATGLDSSIYSGNVRTATTFKGPDGISRLVGVKETNRQVRDQTLGQGKLFKGALDVSSQSFLAVYAPMKDADNQVVGMMFVGRPQALILETAGRSIELTFLVTAVLLLLSVLPVFYISRYLSRQLK